MTEKQYQPGEMHSDEWERDLHPNTDAGQNRGPRSAEDLDATPSAYEVKDVHHQFHGFTDDELKRIPILPVGTRLQQGAVYVSLQDSMLREVKATGDMTAGPNDWFVPKNEVDYQLWNRLIGIDNAERLGDADES